MLAIRDQHRLLGRRTVDMVCSFFASDAIHQSGTVDTIDTISDPVCCRLPSKFRLLLGLF